MTKEENGLAIDCALDLVRRDVFGHDIIEQLIEASQAARSESNHAAACHIRDHLLNHGVQLD